MTDDRDTSASPSDASADSQAAATTTLDDPRVIQDLEEYHERLQRGETPDRQVLLGKHPHLTQELSACLDALEFVCELGPPLDEETQRDGGELGGELGDYRLIREAGRGGMGIVYEAEQVSLRRRVALKLLPFVNTLSAKHLQRFKNEAQAAASLNHPHVVHVYSIGCARGVHYYAMQYVEGLTLAQVIKELRGLDHSTGKKRRDSGEPISEITGTLTRPTSKRLSADSAVEATNRQSVDSRDSTSRVIESLNETERGSASLATFRHQKEYYRMVARLGVQTAEALQHAHDLGVVHRDIKPSNLMVDQSGHLWVTDFGLAQTRTGVGLTMTGEVVGTLRYMCPEQIRGQHGVLDHRADIYSLGVTLYELLTLNTAFAGEDRHELMHRIIDGDVRPPRSLDSSIPRDLETIVLKAMAPVPDDRYAAIHQLRDDLQSFLDEKQIRARRPSWRHRALKWTRRNKPFAATVTLLMALLMTVAAATVWNRYQTVLKTAQDVGEGLAAADALLDAGDLSGATERLATAKTRLNEAGHRQELLERSATQIDERITARRQAEHTLREFETFRQKAYTNMYHVDFVRRQKAYDACVKGLGLYGIQESTNWQQRPDFQLLDKPTREMLAENAAEMLFIVAGVELLPGKDTPGTAPAGHRRALQAWALIETFHSRIPAVYMWSAESWRALGEASKAQEAAQLASSLLNRTALDFFALGEFCAQHDRPQEALVAYAEALRLQPQHYLSLLASGIVRMRLEEYELGEAMLTGAIAVNSKNVTAYMKRADCCRKQGKIRLARVDIALAQKLDASIYRGQLTESSLAEYLLKYFNGVMGVATVHQEGNDAQPGDEIARLTRVIENNPDDADAYNERGFAYIGKSDYPQAVADFAEAIRLSPSDPVLYHLNKGAAHAMSGRLDLALAESDRAIELDPSYSALYANRARTYCEQGELEKALEDYSKAIELGAEKRRADRPSSRINRKSRLYFERGAVYFEKGDVEKGLADYATAIELEPTASAYVRRGSRYARLGEYDDAISDYREALRCDPDSALAYKYLGDVYRQKGDSEQHIASLNVVLQLEPENAAAFGDRGFAHFCVGDFDQAIADFKEGLRIAPLFTISRSRLAYCYQAKGDHQKSLAAFEAVLEIDPVSDHGLRGLAWLLATCTDVSMRDPPRAVELARKAIQVSKPEHAGDRWSTLGVAHYRNGDFKQAVEALDKAAKLRQSPHPADAFFLAMAHWQLGDHETAHQLYQQAMELLEKADIGRTGLLPTDLAEIQLFRTEAAQLMEVDEANEQ